MNVFRKSLGDSWGHHLRLHIKALSTSAKDGGADNAVEQLWQQFFLDPSEWWDNRLGKRDKGYPDFKHKYRNEALWLDTGHDFQWVKTKLTALSQHQSQPRSGLTLLLDYHYGVDLGDPGKHIDWKDIWSSYARERRRESTGHKDDPKITAQVKMIRLPTPCLFSWNTAIAGYSRAGHGEKAFELLKEMQRQGVKPDKFTFVSILGACGAVGDLERGRAVHNEIIKSGVKINLFVWNALVDMYIKCGSIESAREVFDRMCQRDVVSWTALIAAYVKSGDSETALGLFDEMIQQRVEPDRITYVSVLNACAYLGVGAVEAGRKIHEQMMQSSYSLNIYVWNALINMYSKCGSLEDARLVFDEMHPKDVVSWNTMISGYAKMRRGEEALQLYKQMQQEHMMPDKFTFVTILNVCARLGALEEGKKVHAQMIERGGGLDSYAWKSLIHMYNTCGSKEYARKVVDTLRTRV